MKLKLLVIALLLTISNLFAAVIIIPHPGNDEDIQPIAQAIVDKANNGDIIIFPTGRFVVNKTIVIKKFISIRAPRPTFTKLYRSEAASDEQLKSWGAMIRYEINSLVSSKIMVSNINFESKKPSLVNGDGLSRSVDMGIQMVRCVDFRITGCVFKHFGNGAISVIHDNYVASGLIDNNQFIHNAKGYDALGLGYGVVVYGVNNSWITDPRFGSSNFIFIEKNVFTYHRHSVAAGGNALYVFRYNEVYDNTAGNTNHAIDAHEGRLDGTGNHFSSRAIEVYNNKLVNTHFKDGTSRMADGSPLIPGQDPSLLTEAAICTRGGEALIHDNYIEGYRFGIALTANNSSSAVYPIPYQQGYLSAIKYGNSHTGTDLEKGSGDVFVWSNTYVAYSTNPKCVIFYNYSPSYLVSGRDYHLLKKPNYVPYIYPHPGFN